MLREILIVEQRDPSLKRRWFESRYFDLFIWQTPSGAFTKFQLCYDVERNERALVWSQSGGSYHDGVDHGDGVGGPGSGHGQSPIFVPDGRFDSGTVLARFTREAADIPADVREFVLAKIGEHLIQSRSRKMSRRRVRRERWQQRKSGPEGTKGN